MKFSYHILKSLASFRVAPNELAETVTAHLTEVESVTPAGADLSGIFSARVTKLEPHPNADRLKVASLDLGGETVYPVVCGGTNLKVGQVVALARPGSTVPRSVRDPAAGPSVLERAAIRGVESQGMICAAFELCLAETDTDHAIHVLPEKTPLGKPLSEIYPPGDWVVDVSLPANRPDLRSHVGFARALAAISGGTLKAAEPALPKNLAKLPRYPVTIESKKACRQHRAVVLSSVKVGDSPPFIREALVRLGIKPISNVVDVTNYVTQLWGQPLHAFDRSKLGEKMVVRYARPGEPIELLNKKRYELDSETVVIADERRALDVAGIMGGLHTGVEPATTEIVLVASNFEPTGIRRTTRALGVRTEAGAANHEVGLPQELPDVGLAAALELLVAHAGAVPVAFGSAGQKPQPQPRVSASIATLSNLLGVSVAPAEVSGSLKKLMLPHKVTGRGAAAAVSVAPPWWRRDVKDASDIAEEVMKLRGYNKLSPRPLPMLRAPEADPIGELNERVQDRLVSFGYREVHNYSFVSEADVLKLGADPAAYVRIDNPLSREHELLKRHALAPLLNNVNLNQRHAPRLSLFELAREFEGFEQERRVAALVRFGRADAPELLLSQLKGDVVGLLGHLGIRGLRFEPREGYADVVAGNTAIGTCKVVSPDIGERFDITGSVASGELFLEALGELTRDATFQSYPEYPSIARDASIIVPSGLPWERIAETVKPVSGLIESVDVFDAPYFAHAASTETFHRNLAERGQKNLGVRVVFRAKNRTLTDAEVAGIYSAIVLQLQQELGAEIR